MHSITVMQNSESSLAPADISVMESILKQEGLSGEDMKMPGLDPNDTSKTQTK